MNKYIMKRYIISFTVLLAMVFSACQKLDLEPIGVLPQEELFSSEGGVKKYFAGIYNFLQNIFFLARAA